MRYFFLLLFGLNFTFIFGQTHIQGIIKNQSTRQPLAFANITIDDKNGVVSDFDGKFEISIPDNQQTFKVSYIGYETKVIKFDPQKKFYTILLKPATEQLGVVYINGKYTNPAIDLMKKAIKQKKKNNYQSKLAKYAYTKYIKFITGADTEAIKQTFDTLRNLKTNEIKIDSTLYKFVKEFRNKHLWLFESIIKVNAKKGKEKAEVIATRTAGLKNPLYEFLAMQVSGQNVYNDSYKFLFQQYLGPFSKQSLKQYQYEIDDTTRLQGQPVIKVSYKNTKKPLISGKIFLDLKTLAIAKLTLNTYKDFQLNATYSFIYYPQKQLWFPNNVYILIKKAEKKNGITFDNSISIVSTKRDTIITQKGDTLVGTNRKSAMDYMYAKYQIKIFDIQLNKLYPDKIKYDLQVQPLAHQRSEVFWKKYTHTSRSVKEQNTYKFLDSVAQKEKIEYNINKYKRLLEGYYPIKEKADFDLLNLINYNRHEGFRLQLGMKTNENFSDRFQLSGYKAYAFKDKEFKYKSSIRYKISHKTQTYIKLSYIKDLKKTAAFTDYSERSIFMDNHHFADDKFYMQKAFQIQLSHLFSPHIALDINFAQGSIKTEFDIPYHKGRIEFQKQDFSQIRGVLKITPFAKYYLAPEGRKLLKDGYPKFFMSFESNIPQNGIDQTDYFRTDIQVVFKKVFLNKNHTDLSLRTGFATQGSSINKLYQPVTNDFYGNNPFKHFNLEKKYAFETMQDLEFVDNFVLSGHLQHTFTGLKLSSRYKFDLGIIARAAFGLSYDENKYVGIKSLDKIYYESGIELRRLFKFIGLGFYYRLGEYAYPDTWDNLSVRLSLDPIKLFK